MCCKAPGTVPGTWQAAVFTLAGTSFAHCLVPGWDKKCFLQRESLGAPLRSHSTCCHPRKKQLPGAPRWEGLCAPARAPASGRTCEGGALMGSQYFR